MYLRQHRCVDKELETENRTYVCSFLFCWLHGGPYHLEGFWGSVLMGLGLGLVLVFRFPGACPTSPWTLGYRAASLTSLKTSRSSLTILARSVTDIEQNRHGVKHIIYDAARILQSTTLSLFSLTAFESCWFGLLSEPPQLCQMYLDVCDTRVEGFLPCAVTYIICWIIEVFENGKQISFVTGLLV